MILPYLITMKSSNTLQLAVKDIQVPSDYLADVLYCVINLEGKTAKVPVTIPQTKYPVMAVINDIKLTHSSVMQISLLEGNSCLARSDIVVRSMLGSSLTGTWEEWIELDGADQYAELGSWKLQIYLKSTSSNTQPDKNASPTKVKPGYITKDCSNCTHLDRIVLAQQTEMQSIREALESFDDIDRIMKEFDECVGREGRLFTAEDAQSISDRTFIGPQDIEELTHILEDLNNEFIKCANLLDQLPQYRNSLERKHKERVNLQRSITNEVECLMKNFHSKNQRVQDLVKKKEELSKLKRRLAEEIAHKENEELRLRFELSEMKSRANQLQVEDANRQESVDYSDRLKATIAELDRKNADLRKMMKQQLDRKVQLIEEETEKKKVYAAQLGNLRDSSKALQIEYTRRTEDNLELDKLIQDLEKKQATLKKQFEALYSKCQETESARQLSIETASQLESALESASDSISSMYQDLLSHSLDVNKALEAKQDSERALEDLEEEREQHERLIKSHNKDTIDLEVSIAILEQYKKCLEDKRDIDVSRRLFYKYYSDVNFLFESEMEMLDDRKEEVSADLQRSIVSLDELKTSIQQILEENSSLVEMIEKNQEE
jgi:hypothetical protein